MSSVSPSDRSRQNDEVRQAREDYQEAELESAKKNRADKKRMQQQHEQEIAQMRGEYERQLDTVRSKSKSSLSEREQEHQGQIEKIKNLYVEQVRRKSEDNESARTEQKKAYQSEIESLRRTGNLQKEQLTDNFGQSLKGQSEEMQDYQENAQKMMHKAIDERTQKLNQRHDQETQIIESDRSEKLGQAAEDKRKVEQYLKHELKEAEKNHQRKTEALQERWIGVVKNQGENFDSELTANNEILQGERQSMQNRFGQTLEKKLGEIEIAHENLKDQAAHRFDTQVRALQSDLQKAKTDGISQRLTDTRLSHLSEKHLREQFHDQVEDLASNRQEFVSEVNGRAQHMMGENLSKTEKLMQTANRRARMSSEIQNRQAQEDRGNLELEMKDRLDHAQGHEEKHVRNILDRSKGDLQFQQEFHEKTVDKLKDSYANTLDQQRELHSDELQKNRLRTDARFHEFQVKADKKLEQTVTNYEDKIDKLQKNHESEKSRLIELYEQRLSQREKAAHMDQESQAQKYESKLAQSDEVRQKEMERIERRHQDDMAHLSSRVKYLDKKA